jgi:hypothetical protein
MSARTGSTKARKRSAHPTLTSAPIVASFLQMTRSCRSVAMPANLCAVVAVTLRQTAAGGCTVVSEG